MHDVAKPAAQPPKGPRYAELHRRFPTVMYLRDYARRHAPHFAFEYMDGGAGADRGIARNWAALDAVEIVPRYGVATSLPPLEVELFGRRYAAPFGIAPMGGPSIVRPGADLLLAKAAQRARVPYVLGMVGGATIEQVAELAPDVFWFQLYRCAKNDHAIGFDVVHRADAAGAHVLILTLDVPVRTTRSREVVVGLGGAARFRLGPRLLWDMMLSPSWLLALAQHGRPRFANLRPYVAAKAGLDKLITFARSEIGGAFSWEEVARYRDRWKGPLLVKGILHPADAEQAVKLGVDGIIVSNHGGRQVEALPAAIDCLPAIARAVGARATVLMDSGIRSGTDVVRALALGASAVFAGKAFLWGVAAIGRDGPGHVIDLLAEETQAVLGQIGARTPGEARKALVRHPGALQF
ncbi:MAG TPA: alpha-hydroxy acid oxidase [Xanthobacteraceae bacterium]|nr:alpha-hydroxy acid oxidase [Xanthobacteraceae bacterium]